MLQFVGWTLRRHQDRVKKDFTLVAQEKGWWRNAQAGVTADDLAGALSNGRLRFS